MMRNTIAHCPREIQSLPVVLEHVHDAQALLVMIEASGNQLVQHALARVAERGVAQVVSERNRFSELLVELQDLGNRSRDLRHLERVRQPRAVVIASRSEKYLCLVLEPAERLAMHDAVAVVLER